MIVTLGFFQLPRGCPMVKFRPLPREQSQSADVNHWTMLSYFLPEDHDISSLKTQFCLNGALLNYMLRFEATELFSPFLLQSKLSCDQNNHRESGADRTVRRLLDLTVGSPFPHYT